MAGERSGGLASSKWSDTPKTPSNVPSAAAAPTRPAAAQTTAEEAHDAALRAELESVRRMNAVVEGVTASLDKARANMGTISRTIAHASAMLDTWTRILSQTEHNQRLLLHPAWAGASADAAEAESEAHARRRDGERREREEAQRREDAEERRRAEEERRAAQLAQVGARAARRGRPGSVGGGAGRGVVGSAVGGDVTPAPQGRGVAAARRAVRSYGRVGSVGTRAGAARGGAKD